MGQIQSLTEETYLGTAAGGECTAFKGNHCYLTVCVCEERHSFVVSFIINDSLMDQTYGFFRIV